MKRNKALVVECRLCGKEVVLMVTKKDYEEFFSPNRRNIQDIFPYLSADERELLISHTCEDCWNKMFEDLGDEDDEDINPDDILTDEEFEALYGLDCEEFYKSLGNVSVAELNEVF